MESGEWGRQVISVLLLVVILLSSGCASILEGDTLIYSPYEPAQDIGPPEDQVVVSNYEELKSAMLNIVMQYDDIGLIIILSYDGYIQEDVDRAASEIITSDPIGAYAVSDIAGIATRIVTYFEVEISVEYKRTRQQVESIVTVSRMQELRGELLDAMRSYREDLLIRTDLRNVMEDDILSFVRGTYYNNPLSIVMMPITAIDTFPEAGSDRVFEISFGHLHPANILRENTASLVVSVQRNAEAAVGESDAEKLLSLAEILIAASIFDEEQARTISEHGAQNFAATALGALVSGNAVGEGFAMAFKALCDELEIDCRVVLGYLDGMVHAWNIVMLYGDYYHIDVSMGAINGLETAFLKNDLDFTELYSWDTGNTVRCQGTMTYWDVVDAQTPSPVIESEEDD